MGGSKKQTVGYRYYLGAHKILCHGPVDAIKRIFVDKRLAWEGRARDALIYINKPYLFGGDRREGGVEGYIQIQSGKSDQVADPYLVSQLGSDIPAFRGVLGAVFRRTYMGATSYLKPWSFEVQRVYTASDGGEQWYSAKAGIADYGPMALYLTIDASGSMDEITPNGLSRLDNVKIAIQALLESFRPHVLNGLSLDIYIGAYSTTVTSESYFLADENDLDTAIAFVGALVTTGSTDFETGVEEAPTFFSTATNIRKVVLFLSDGQTTTGDANDARTILDTIANVETYAFNIDEEDTTYTAIVDNTPIDGVPVTLGGSQDILGAIIRVIGNQIDMNAAHILKEVLTDNEWGLGYLESDIDEASFINSADQIFAEGMGLSLFWDTQTSVQEFIQEVIRHINGVLDIDKSTGKFKLKLVRDDYDESEILILDRKNIKQVKDYTRQGITGDVVNKVTVKYWDYKTGETSSVSVDDISLIHAQGGTVGTTIQYPGFTKTALAAQAAQRDLRTLSSPLLTCTIIADREASVLTTGDVFRFGWPKYHEGYVVMRVLEVAYGSSKSNRVQIKAIEDVFALPASTYLVTEESGSEDITGAALPLTARAVTEMTYYDMVLELGHTATDNLLSGDPDSGLLAVAAGNPGGGALNYTIFSDDSVGFEENAIGDFCPSMVITDAAPGRTETVFTYEQGSSLEMLVVGAQGYWDGEIIRLDAIDEMTSEITIGRGCLDTIPLQHEAESSIVWWNEYVQSNNTEYFAGQELDVKLLTNASDQLDINSAPVDVVEFASRAFRPFPPADVKFNGDYWPDIVAIDISGEAAVSWVARNRFQQTGVTIYDFFDANITPEEGTEWQVITRDVLNNTVDDSGLISTMSYQAKGFGILGGTFSIEVISWRDGYECLNSVKHTFTVPGIEGTNDDELFFGVGSGTTMTQANDDELDYDL